MEGKNPPRKTVCEEGDGIEARGQIVHGKIPGPRKINLLIFRAYIDDSGGYSCWLGKMG